MKNNIYDRFHEIEASFAARNLEIPKSRNFMNNIKKYFLSTDGYGIELDRREQKRIKERNE